MIRKDQNAKVRDLVVTHSCYQVVLEGEIPITLLQSGMLEKISFERGAIDIDDSILEQIESVKVTMKTPINPNVFWKIQKYIEQLRKVPGSEFISFDEGLWTFRAEKQ